MRHPTGALPIHYKAGSAPGFLAAQSNSRWTLPLPGATTDGVLSTRGGREGGVKRTFIMLQKRSSGEVRGWARLLLNEVKNWDRAATAPT